MNHSSINDKRRLIPRWRSFNKASLTGELSSIVSAPESKFSENSVFFDSNIQSWNYKKSIENASEIVFYSFTVGKPELAIEQATYLYRKTNVGRELKSLIDFILANKVIQNIDERNQLTGLRESFYYEINKLKKQLANRPRSSVYWVDIARLYSALGERERAQRAIKAALHLSKNNRFVIRSAIRFFVHTGDQDELSKVFMNYEYLQKDQWVLASYISLHDFLRKKKVRVKKAEELINLLGKYQTTELSGALASLELESGAIKGAKKFFKASMLNPNDNSLAQIAWAEQHVGRIANISQISVPFDYEAQTRELLRYNSADESLKKCIQWMVDEPYSVMPAIVGSHIASVFSDDIDSAKQFCEVGLNANPMNKTLLNNSAFCHAKTGDVDMAIKSLNKIRDVEKNTSLDVSFRATAGLVAIRSGEVEIGRKLYFNSIELAKKLGMSEHRAIAAMYLAEEELNIKEKSREEIEALIKHNMPKEKSKVLETLYKNINVKIALEFERRRIFKK